MKLKSDMIFVLTELQISDLQTNISLAYKYKSGLFKVANFVDTMSHGA